MTLPTLTNTPARRLLIDGSWVDARAGRTLPSINPSTGETIASIADADADDVDLAVAAARRAFVGPWRRFTPAQRQNVLLRLADLVEQHFEALRLLDVVDMGTPVGRRLPAGPIETLRYFAGWSTKIHGETLPNSVPGSMFTYTLREPVGVCGAITPWNGPLGSAIWKIAPVLASGCTVVLKPSEEASLSPLRLGELIQELDLPPGVVNIVTGGGTAGAALCAHPDVDKIAFTGSTRTGQAVLRAAVDNLKRVSLELGGKSPDIVFADADFDRAVPGAALGVFANSGQVCCAGTRLYVERPRYDEFVDRMAEFASGLVVGDSMDAATQIGPVVSQAQLNRIEGYLASGREEGARVAAGGTRLTHDGMDRGFFVAPTVFADVDDQMRIAREEIFGPVAAVMPFDSIEEVVTRANDTQYGLGGGVWTRDVGKAHHLAGELRSGIVWVNTYGSVDPAVPFGGVGMSGWGSELGAQGLDEYLNVKAVWINTDGSHV